MADAGATNEVGLGDLVGGHTGRPPGLQAPNPPPPQNAGWFDRFTPREKAAIATGLVVFTLAGAAIAIWLAIDGSGGGKESAKMRSGAEEVDQAVQASAASDGHQWSGQAAQSYDDRQATLTGLQQLMADTDQKVAAALDTHGQQLDTTRNVLDAADLKITACTPMAESLLAIPNVGPALSLKFQLAIAMPLLAGCNTAQQQTQHSSTHTATQIDTATDTYHYIATTATTLT